MKRKCFLVVVAAGHGVRMGAGMPKQFLNLSGVAILQRTISKFLDAVPGITVVTVLPQEQAYVDWWREYCLAKNFNCPQIVTRGGITRFHSVRAALEKVPDGAVVAIHDGVRPLLSKEMIQKMFSKITSDDGCRALIPVVPTVDTVKRLRKRGPESSTSALEQVPGPSPDRSELYCSQTPQMFRSEDIRAAYCQAYDTSFSDDASVASKYGIPLTFCDGERLNFKITSPEDMTLAEAVLLAKR